MRSFRPGVPTTGSHLAHLRCVSDCISQRALRQSVILAQILASLKVTRWRDFSGRQRQVLQFRAGGGCGSAGAEGLGRGARGEGGAGAGDSALYRGGGEIQILHFCPRGCAVTRRVVLICRPSEHRVVHSPGACDRAGATGRLPVVRVCARVCVGWGPRAALCVRGCAPSGSGDVAAFVPVGVCDRVTVCCRVEMGALVSTVWFDLWFV